MGKTTYFSEDLTAVGARRDSEEIKEEEVAEDDDEYSYIEEIIESEEDDEIVEDEESVVEEVLDDDEVVQEDSDIGDSDSGSGEYMDDDSSAPPASFDSDVPVFEGDEAGIVHHGNGGIDPEKREKVVQLEISNAAVSEGARKAMEDELNRERSIQRKAARDALQRKRMEQEAAMRRGDLSEAGTQNSERNDRRNSEDDAARIRLIEEIRKVDLALARNRDASAIPTRIRSSAGVDTRKKALAELRRQAARDELARNNQKLKNSKGQHEDSRTSTAGQSIRSVRTYRPTTKPLLEKSEESGSPTPSAPGHLDQTRLKDSIQSVEVPSVLDPISPLRGTESLHRRSWLPLDPPPLDDDSAEIQNTKPVPTPSQSPLSSPLVASLSKKSPLSNGSSSRRQRRKVQSPLPSPPLHEKETPRMINRKTKPPSDKNTAISPPASGKRAINKASQSMSDAPPSKTLSPSIAKGSISRSDKALPAPHDVVSPSSSVKRRVMKTPKSPLASESPLKIKKKWSPVSPAGRARTTGKGKWEGVSFHRGEEGQWQTPEIPARAFTG